MERSDGVMDTWIGVRYPYYVRIEIKPRQLVRAISDLQFQCKPM